MGAGRYVSLARFEYGVPVLRRLDRAEIADDDEAIAPVTF
jgi:hypothetical protein